MKRYGTKHKSAYNPQVGVRRGVAYKIGIVVQDGYCWYVGLQHLLLER